MKLAITGITALILLTGMAAPACYANGTNIIKNTHASDKVWNTAWGAAWALSKHKAQTDEPGALAMCRDTMMNADKLYETPQEYEVILSDSMRKWTISINSKGDGKGSAVCAVQP